MRTHTYWITYEEYLAYGGVPSSTPIRGAIPYKRGLRGAIPYLTKKSGVYGVGGLRGGHPVWGDSPVSCPHQVHTVD